MRKLSDQVKMSTKEYLLIAFGLLLALLLGVAAVFTKNYILPLVPVMVLVFVVYFILLFREPFIGLLVLIVYCFILFFFYREIGMLPYGVGIEFFMVLTWLSVWYNADKLDFSLLNTNLVWLYLGWLLLCILQIANPAGGSVRGWLAEIRGMGIYPIALSGLGLLLINTKERISQVLKLLVTLSLLGALYGMKQKYIGLSAGDQRFVHDFPTHLIWGQLRVFSFYIDAGQYGASMAIFVVVALILAIGLKNTKTRLMLLGSVPLFGIAMLISGTRGAFFALIAAGGFALLLTKKFKILLAGCVVLGLFVAFLKFTDIGSGNYAIFRFRSALDPKDASLNLRFINQKKLADYLSSHPFGGGLGVIGAFGHEYNADQYLSTIEPDSYWVKVWAQTGIIGFTLWFCMIMYLLGKGCGITWGIRDPNLRVKLIALNAGIAGIFACSYGNEVINNMPSNIFVNLSFAMIFNAAALDKARRQE
jgi:O-antigen ligase